MCVGNDDLLRVSPFIIARRYSYAASQNRVLDEGALAAAMTWSEPSRGVALPRERALQLIGAGSGLHCVWSGRRLDAATLDTLPALVSVALR